MKTFTNTLMLLFTLLSLGIYAQKAGQTIRGTVLDKQSQNQIPGANITILGSSPLKGCVTDAEGRFKITGMPLPRTRE